MESSISLDAAYLPSEDVVARDIEGELIIVPLVAGIGDMEDGLFSLNDTGKGIWEKLDGKNSVKEIIEKLSGEFEAPSGVIRKDVIGLMEELLKRGMIVEATES